MPNKEDNELWRTEGHFWIDDQTDNSLPGTLAVYKRGGAELRLLGAFESLTGTINVTDTVRHAAINGTTEKYANICLVHPLQINKGMSFRGVDTLTYQANLVFASSTSHSVTEQSLLVLKLQVQGLDKWLGISGFARPRNLGEQPIEVTYQLPEIIRYALSDRYDLEWQFSATGPTYTHPQTEISIKQSAHLVIRARKPASINEMHSEAQKIADFLRLAMGEPVESTVSEVQFAIPTTAINGNWSNAFLALRSTSSAEAPHQSHMLFIYEEIKHRFDTIIKRWAENAASLSAVYQFYFATIRSPEMYAEHRLMSFFQAIESYHRITYRNDLVINRSPERNGKPISAGERMYDLVTRTKCGWIFDVPYENSVNRIAKVRNYIVHRERKPSDDDLSLLAMYNAGSRCQLVCEIALLDAAGFDLDEINTKLQSMGRLARLLAY